MYERFIARQPIFDRRLNVVGYELLFRSGPHEQFTPDAHATANVIVDSTMLMRLEALVGPQKAFINMSHEELCGGSAFLLSSSKTVIEIAKDEKLTGETILACESLKQAGYSLVLDGFRDEPHWQPLLRFASVLKVDFRDTTGEEQKAIARKYAGNGLKFAGKRIETRQEFKHAANAGYSLFQGFFFLKPETIAARDLPASKINCLRLLRESAAPELRYGNVEEILKQEPGLLYKLLRYLNSAAHGLVREVHSVPHAIALLGDKEFRRWVSVVAIVGASLDEPTEVLRAGLVRAYFCEGLSQFLGIVQGGTDFFLMGLVSVLDVLFARPLPEILDELPLSEDVRSALLGGRNVHRDLYEAVLAYEDADWGAFRAAAGRAKLNQESAAEQYEAAVRQASNMPELVD